MSADCGAALVAGAVADATTFVEVPGATGCAEADAEIVMAKIGQSHHGPMRLLISVFAGWKGRFTAWRIQRVKARPVKWISR